MLGCNGLTAAGVPHAAGAAMAANLRGEKRVAVAFLGDGAANQGVLYETLNLAGIWKIPLIVVCENNQYAMSTRYSEMHSTADIADKAAGFGIPTEVVDGMDVHAVRAAILRAVERGRAGEGPVLHSNARHTATSATLCATTGRNEPRKRCPPWRARDPLVATHRDLLDGHGCTEDEIAAIDDEEAAALERAVELAEAAPEPPPSALLEGVYNDEPFVETPPPRTEQEEERQLAYAAALNEALAQEMAADDSIILFGEDIAEMGGVFGVTTGLQERFGHDRVRDAPIFRGSHRRPRDRSGAGRGPAVVEIQFMDILTLATDQLVNQAAKVRYMLGGKPKVPLVVRTPLGAGVKLAAQHSQSLEAWYAHVPGLIVAVPSTAYDAKGLLTAAIRNPNPVLFLEHKLLYFLTGPVPEESYTLPFGVADVKREGTDITVVATSAMVRKALQVARRLGRKGVSVEVVDPRTIAPLDIDTIRRSVRKTGRLLVVHEACRFGGIGGEIVAQVMEEEFRRAESAARGGSARRPRPCLTTPSWKRPTSRANRTSPR